MVKVVLGCRMDVGFRLQSPARFVSPLGSAALTLASTATVVSAGPSMVVPFSK